MQLVIVFMYTHVGVSSGDASSHKCRDLSDSLGHASSVLLRVASVLALSHKCRDLNESPGHAEPFCYVILRCGVAIANVNIIHVTSRVASCVASEMPRAGARIAHAEAILFRLVMFVAFGC